MLTAHMTGQQLVPLITYLIQAGETQDALMTVAQQLEQKCIEKGIQLVEQSGIEKGNLEDARTLSENGLDRGTVMKMTSLSEEQLDQICHFNGQPF